MKKLLALLLLLSACGEQKSEIDYSKTGEKAYGDMYVSASIGEASNLVPFLATDSASHAISGMLYNSLLKYDKDYNLIGDLAESWDISDDNLTFTFTLKKGVEWQDGTPLTAHDVMATFNAITNPNTRTPYAGDYQIVKEAKVLNDYTFQVTYNEPFAPALSSWAGLSILPKHILELDEDVNETRLKNSPVASGSYLLKSWNVGKESVMVANPRYFDGEPYITTLRTRIIPDQDTQFLELKAERIDTMGLKPVQFELLTSSPEFTKKFAKYEYLQNVYTYFGFNLKNPMFTKLTRQALSHATPRQQIIDGILRGKGVPLNAPFKPGTWAYNENLVPYDYNLEKAAELLKQDGWVKGENGILQKEINGNMAAFSFTVVTNQGNDARIKTAEILQAHFKKIGIDMQIRVQEWSTFVENTLHGKDFDAIILGWSLTPEPDPFDIWHSSKQNPREFNIIGFENKEADEAMEAARRTFNQEERKKYLDKFQEIIHEEQPYIFLFAPKTLVAVHKRFKNIEEAPAGISYNFEKWYVPSEQQMYKNNVITQ